MLPNKQQLECLLHHERVMDYVQRHYNVYLEDAEEPYTELSADEIALARELAAFVRRIMGKPTMAKCASFNLPLKSFFNIPDSALAQLESIELASRAGSAIDSAAANLFLNHKLKLLLAQDIHAACLRDGIRLDYETVRELVLGQREPRTIPEQLIDNALSVITELSETQLPELTDRSILELYERVVPTDLRDLLEETPFDSSRQIDNRLQLPGEEQDSLGNIAVIARESDFFDAPVLCNVIFNSSSIWALHSFRRGNGLMEVIVRQATLRYHGLPVLAYLPYSRAHLDWENGLYPDMTRIPYGKGLIFNSFGIDSTPYLLQAIDLYARELDALDALKRSVAEDMERLHQNIDEDFRLNLRQKNLLHTLLDGSTATIDLATYRATFDVALETARTDLRKARQFGYLIDDWEGKKKIYRLSEAC